MTPTTIGILGIGQMGASAAVCFSRAGLPVLVWARDAAKLAALPAELARMGRFLDEHVGPAAAAPAAVTPTTDLADLNARAEVVLECVAEDLGQKAELLRRLAPAAQRGAILTSCTSGLSISAMGRAAGVGRRLVGAHFWNPPHLMPVVEVIRGDETDAGLEEVVCGLLRRAGKRPVICKDVPGFIGNRLLFALYREAVHLVQSGTCSAADVDLVARLTFGLRLPAVGPCANMDLVGLELIAQIQAYLLADLSDARGPMPLVRQMLAEGRTGLRAGRGFHEWTDAGKAELIDRRDRQIVRQLRFLREEEE